MEVPVPGYNLCMVMVYPEEFVAPMRGELVRAGVEELRTPAAVDEAVRSAGTTLVVVNSICGCAAGKARPGIAKALLHAKRPAKAGTVFAGADIEATARAREHMAPYPPSSPSVGLFKDGQLVFMLQRRDIETRTAEMIADELTKAFDQFC